MPRQLRSERRSNFFILTSVMGFMVMVGLATMVISHADSVNYFDNAYIHVTPLTVSATLDRQDPGYSLMNKDNAQYTNGLIYGPGFSISGNSATLVQIRNTTPTGGVGFFESSSGLAKGQQYKIHTDINPSKPDGTYTGSAIVFYYSTTQKQWFSGPTVDYTIKLIN